MGRYILAVFTCLVLFGALSSQSAADPSGPIAAMMNTPATVFDVFLSDMYQESKCYRGWFGNLRNSDGRNMANLCMTSINYKFDDDVIVMHFFIGSRNKKMKGFDHANLETKKFIMTGIVKQLAKEVGVAKNRMGLEYGMIQTTPIRYGWADKRFNEAAAIKQIAARTVIDLVTDTDGAVFTVTRNQHGVITFKSDKSYTLPPPLPSVR